MMHRKSERPARRGQAHHRKQFPVKTLASGLIATRVDRVSRPLGRRKRVGDLVVPGAACCGQNKIGPVEDVKRLRLKLQVHPLRQFEHLAQRHVGTEEIWSDEGITAQTPNTAEARCRESVVYEAFAQSVRPL